MALLVEHPVDWAVFAAGWIALDMGRRAQIVGDEVSQVVGVVGGIHDDVTNARQPFDQAARLGAVAPLARCDREPDGQPERIDTGVDFGRQAAFGSADAGSLKPPF